MLRRLGAPALLTEHPRHLLRIPLHHKRDQVGDPLTLRLLRHPQLEVVDRIPRAVAIAMVEVLTRQQWSAERLLHDPAVLCHDPPTDTDVVVTVGVVVIRLTGRCIDPLQWIIMRTPRLIVTLTPPTRVMPL